MWIAAGVMALAKHASAKNEREMERERVRDSLHAGPLLHYLSVAKRQAGLPFHTIAHDQPTPDSSPCELHVLQVEQVALTGQAAERWGPTAYECLLELITGKTHQVRVPQGPATEEPLYIIVDVVVCATGSLSMECFL